MKITDTVFDVRDWIDDCIYPLFLLSGPHVYKYVCQFYSYCYTFSIHRDGTVYSMEWSHGLESWIGAMEWSIGVDSWSGTLE